MVSVHSVYTFHPIYSQCNISCFFQVFTLSQGTRLAGQKGQTVCFVSLPPIYVQCAQCTERVARQESESLRPA